MNLEEQLRRYGEHAERLVAPSGPRASLDRPRGRSSRVLVTAVVVVCVAGIVSWSVSRAVVDDDGRPPETVPTGAPTSTPSATVAPTTVPPGSTTVPAAAGDPGLRQSFSQVWTGSELVVFGGRTGDDPNTATDVADGFAYTPATGTWRAIEPAPEARSGHAAVWVGGEMFVLGGTRAGIDVYDPATDTWRRLPEPPLDLRPGAPAAQAVAVGDRLVVWSPQEGAAAVFDPADGSWARLAPTSLGGRAARLHVTGSDAVVVITADERSGALSGAVLPLDGSDAQPIPPVRFVARTDRGEVQGAADVRLTGLAGQHLLAWSWDGQALQAMRHELGSPGWTAVDAPAYPACEGPSLALDAGDSVLTVHPCSGDWARFDPQAGQWRDLGHLRPDGESPIVTVPPVAPVWTGDGLIGWASPFVGGASFEPFLWRRAVPVG